MDEKKTLLVTGGAGYIGSHSTVELLNEGYEVIILDNLSNSSEDIIDRINQITNKKVTFYNVDLLDKEALEFVFENHLIDLVIHFAGFKAVGESVNQPLKYYRNNIMSTLNLCEVMERHNVFNLIFSSSATVYGVPEKLPLDEICPTNALNPYGQTKLMIEEILIDLSATNSKWKIGILRYFNPVGAHHSGLIGENPNGTPNNLMPLITQVAAGKLEKLSIFGNNYSTKDGTGVRDYIHVVDLAKGHLKAIENIEFIKGTEVFNLGTGQGYSVLEVIHTFEYVNEVKVPYEIVERRPGDTESCYADPTKANEKLGWFANKGLIEMCRDAWEWEMKKELTIK